MLGGVRDVIIFHVQTQSSLLFSCFGRFISKGSSYHTIERSKLLPLYRVAAVELSPYIDLVLPYLHFLVFWDCRSHNRFVSRVALNPGLGEVRDVASAIISHEHTQ